ncbi:hypothetical protein L873DRAFT_1786171 [Choiromyces venosus 120613-1]|uniref:Uncharacterized protein n=1 Tax=Choiromyces venosus 120613-1 TaxID=1336337 RepID=A0A3N4K316_9PEZI|nr:hypothetical protein L873DRAFT_1786171 [Choiromyces venosus 120613-1]
MREVGPEEKYQWTEENLEQRKKGLGEVEDIEEIEEIKDMDIMGGPKSLLTYLMHTISGMGNSHMITYLNCQEYYKRTIRKVHVEGDGQILLCVLCMGLDYGIPGNGEEDRDEGQNLVRVREFMEMSKKMKQESRRVEEEVLEAEHGSDDWDVIFRKSEGYSTKHCPFHSYCERDEKMDLRVVDE